MLFKSALLAIVLFIGCAIEAIVLPTTALAQTSPTAKSEEITLLEAARTEIKNENYPAAINLLNRALIIFDRQGDLKGRAVSLFQLGTCYANSQKYPQAIDYLQQSLKISRQIGNRNLEANILKNLGNLAQRLEKYQAAIDYHRQALIVFRELADRRNEASIYKNLGDIYSRLGKYQLAIDYHQQSLEIFRKTSNSTGEGTALGELGFLSQLLGKDREAIAYHEQALQIFRRTNNSIGQANSFNDLGNISQKIGDDLAANNYFQQALQIYRQQNQLGKQAPILIGLGNVAAHQNRDRAAIDRYKEALQIARQLKYQIVESAALNNLGIMSRKLGRYQEAIDYHQQALEISRKLGNKANEGSNLANIGISEYRRRRPSVAVDYLQQASDITDALRLELSDADRVSLFETQLYYYKLLTAARVLNRDSIGSLIATERGRTRIFAELLSKRLANSSNLPQSSVLTFEQIQTQARSRQATIVSYSMLQDYDVESPLKPDGKPHKLLIHVISPTGELTVRESLIPKGVELARIIENNRTELLAAADPTTPLSRSRGSRGISLDRLIVGMQVRIEGDPPETRRKVVSIDARKQLVTLQSPDPTAANDVVEFSQLILAAAPQQEHLELARLHQLLIAPIADLLPANPLAPVIFIPDSALYEVPFAALKNERGQYLIDLHTISIAPSLSVLAQTAKLKQRNIPTTAPSLVIGNPDFKGLYKQLPSSENEARDISRLFPSKLLLGSAASESAVMQWLPSARVIHFATHGFTDDSNGLNSKIILSPSGSNAGNLTAEKVLNLNLRADLVVLSACDTGRGKITGDGVIGLSRSFISAGANSAIVSLWSVDDKATSILMTDFYRQWQGGKSKAQALRAAMLSTKAQYPDPYYWSSMSLYGEIN
jgi:CHAT domain-containing protein